MGSTHLRAKFAKLLSTDACGPCGFCATSD